MISTITTCVNAGECACACVDHAVAGGLVAEVALHSIFLQVGERKVGDEGPQQRLFVSKLYNTETQCQSHQGGGAGRCGIYSRRHFLGRPRAACWAVKRMALLYLAVALTSKRSSSFSGHRGPILAPVQYDGNAQVSPVTGGHLPPVFAASATVTWRLAKQELVEVWVLSPPLQHMKRKEATQNRQADSRQAGRQVRSKSIAIDYCGQLSCMNRVRSCPQAKHPEIAPKGNALALSPTGQGLALATANVASR